MTWFAAYSLARQLAAEKRYRWFVRGYKATSGKWRYACHSDSLPLTYTSTRSTV